MISTLHSVDYENVTPRAMAAARNEMKTTTIISGRNHHEDGERLRQTAEIQDANVPVLSIG